MHSVRPLRPQGRAVALVPLGALPKVNASKLGDQLEVRCSTLTRCFQPLVLPRLDTWQQAARVWVAPCAHNQ